MPFKNLGKHRISQQTQDFAVYDVSAGLNIKATPQEVADNELTIAINGYLRDDGSFSSRFGVTAHGTPYSLFPTDGLIRFFQQTVAGVAITTKTFTLAQSNGTLYDVDRNVSYGGAGVLGTGGQPWSVTQIFDPDRNGGTDVLIICTGQGGPYIFDGTTVYTPTGWSSGFISGAQYVELINGILWFAGVPGSPNLVFGSELQHPETIEYYNEIAVSRTITGLGVIGAGAQAALACGMTQGVSLVIGTGPSNFVVVEMPSEDGCVSYRSMITVNGILYYQGQFAMYRCDGYSITPISNKVEPWILNDPVHQEYPMNGNRELSWSFFWNNKVYFWYDSGNVGYTNVALVYDVIRNGFTIYDGIAFMSGCLLNAPGDPQPTQAVMGNALTGQAYNFESSTPVPAIPASFWPTSDAGLPIFVQAQTKYFKIGDPGTPKTLLRTYPEIFGTIAQPSLGIATNYGPQGSQTLIPIGQNAGATWGEFVWGQAMWSSSALQFDATRLDHNIQAEAFAFSMTSNDTNPPWRWVGLTGVFSQGGKA